MARNEEDGRQKEDSSQAETRAVDPEELTSAMEGSRLPGAAAGASAEGMVIGPYRLLQMVGEGGMGEVWLAEQKQPVRRRVAIKLIKAGMDTREVVARFESERQALALMDHPAIAKVFDAGSTLEGRPFFVMEFVAGSPITRYCDQHKLTLKQRLELFMLVCEGVQHAHQKAIIHRDLKPSNILVTEVNGKPMPRIIDFGVAKATSQRLTADTMYTRIGMVIGTLGYMSPEQAEPFGADPNREDIDTRTDVYSLGVVLYELLVGALPLDLGRLALDEGLRRLREQDAPRPSTRLRTLEGKASTDYALNRQSDPTTLLRQLRGDPDAIALKALEKDRRRRYATPSDLAADIGRYLRNEPVLAHAPSATYRLGKYVRRHRLGVGLAGALLLLLIAFAVAQAVELRRIRRERDRADRITTFMTGMFRVSDPSESRGNKVTAREILDQASTQIDTELARDPELQARMIFEMAQTYAGLGLYSRAHTLLDRAIQIQQRVLGAQSPQTLTTQSHLASVMSDQGQLAEAEKLQRATIATRRKVMGKDDAENFDAMTALAATLDDEGKTVEAEQLDRTAVAGLKKATGPESAQTLLAMSNLAEVLEDEGQLQEAEQLDRETFDTRRRVLGAEHPQTLRSEEDLATCLTIEGRFPEAEKLAQEVYQGRLHVQGPEHLDTLYAARNLGDAMMRNGKYKEAEKLETDTLDIERRVLGPEHAGTLVAMSHLAVAYMHDGQYAEADKLYRQVIEIDLRVLGPANPATTDAEAAEASNLARSGKYPEAEKLFQNVTNVAEASGQTGYAQRAWYNFACAAAIAGRKDDAFRYLDRSIQEGFLDPGLIADDSDLASLHGDPRFNAEVAKAKGPTVKTQ